MKIPKLSKSQLFALTVFYLGGQVKTGWPAALIDHRGIQHRLWDKTLMKLKDLGLLTADFTGSVPDWMKNKAHSWKRWRITEYGRQVGSELHRTKQLVKLPELHVGYIVERVRDRARIREVRWIWIADNKVRTVDVPPGYCRRTTFMGGRASFPWYDSEVKALEAFSKENDRRIDSLLREAQQRKNAGLEVDRRLTALSSEKKQRR